MKKIAIEVLALGVLLASAGCVRTDLPDLSDGEIVVRLNVDGMATKAEDDVLDGYIYLFDNVDAAPYKTIDIDASGTTTLDFATVFGSDADKLKRTTVFAVTGESSAASPSSLADLKDKAITAPLFLDGNKVKSDPQFYMTAEGEFEKVNDNTTACNLTLKRLAAKVALELDIPASITTNGDWEFKAGTTYEATTTWTPMTSGENARVYLQNAVSNTTLGAASDPAVLPGSFTTFTYAPVFMNGATVSAPFYTYPVSWIRGDEKEPFIKLILPWRYETTVKKDGKDVVVDQNVVEFYYKIMFPAGITSFEANTYYLPKVTLNILGGEAARPTVIGADGLTIMNWRGVESSEMPAVSINPADFLVPERETFEVSNGNPLQIKYFASGEVNFTVKEIYKDVYTNDNTARRYIYSTYTGHTFLSSIPIQDTDAVKDRYNREFSNKDDKTGTETAWFTNSAFDTDTKSGILTLNHTLSDNFDLPNFAARPYHYEVELSLKDNSSVKKTITIIQNPPVQAEGQLSTGWVMVDNQAGKEGTKRDNHTSLTWFKARENGDGHPQIWTSARAFYNYGTASGYANNSIAAYSGYQDENKAVYVLGVADALQVTANYSIGYLYTYAYLDPAGTNVSRYRILVSVAPMSSFFVGDPREDLTSSSNLWDVFTKRVNGRTNGIVENESPLTGDAATVGNLTSTSSPYKPTLKEGVEKIIAPKFLVASSYGRGSTTIYESAVLRCAAYQEDGYPAGRWRIPTEAEIEYCIQLQNAGAIPELFRTSSGSGYFASSGRRILKKEGSADEKELEWLSSGNANIRCVYDTWYWGNEEEDLKTAAGKSEIKDYTQPQYRWSGYMTSK